MSGLGLRLGIDRWFGRGASGVSLPSNSVAPAITGDPVVGQRLYSGTGTWSNSPTTYEYQWYKDNAAISGEITDNYLVVDANVGSVFKCRVTASNGAGSAQATSSNTSAVTDISLTNAISSVTRTSASGVTPMTADIAFASNVYEGYFLQRIVYTDSGLTTYKGGSLPDATATHTLTNADLQSGATIDWSGDGGPAIAATDWVVYRVVTSSPNGLEYEFQYSPAISPTDAVTAMTWSTSDSSGVAALNDSNLQARNASNPAGIRASRGVSSGKFYVEFLAYSGQLELLDGTASLTTDQSSSGTPSTHAAVWPSNDTNAYFNATTYSVGNTFTGGTITCSISGTTLTLTSGTLSIGQYIAGANIAWGTQITGGSGATWTVSISQTRSDDGIPIPVGYIIQMAVDATNDKVWFGRNNTFGGSPSAGTGGLSISGIGKPVFPAFRFNAGGGNTVIFPGTTPGTTTGFIFTPPTGFVAP